MRKPSVVPTSLFDMVEPLVGLIVDETACARRVFDSHSALSDPSLCCSSFAWLNWLNCFGGDVPSVLILPTDPSDNEWNGWNADSG